jgi:hypothetical protein
VTSMEGRRRGQGGGVPLRREGNERCPDRNTEVSHFLSGDRSEDRRLYSRAQERGRGADHRKGYKQASLNIRERGQGTGRQDKIEIKIRRWFLKLMNFFRKQIGQREMSHTEVKLHALT